MSKRRTALVAAVGLIAGAGAYAITAIAPVGPARWGVSAEAPLEKRWQAVAPGRVKLAPVRSRSRRPWLGWSRRYW